MPFHAHEVFEDAWKSGPEAERDLWQGLAQLAVGLTHAARGNAAGGARLLRRGADRLAAGGVPTGGSPAGGSPGPGPYGIDVGGLVSWARELAARTEGGEGDGGAGPGAVDAAAEAPRLRRDAA